jgi:hypothetical protein
VEEYGVLEWSTYDDRTTKRHDIEDKVSSGDSSSKNSKGLGDEVHTPWLLQSVTTLEEDKAQISGVLIRGKDGMQSSSALFKEEDSTQIGSAQIRLEDIAHMCGVYIGQEGRV